MPGNFLGSGVWQLSGLPYISVVLFLSLPRPSLCQYLVVNNNVHLKLMKQCQCACVYHRHSSQLVLLLVTSSTSSVWKHDEAKHDEINSCIIPLVLVEPTPIILLRATLYTDLHMLVKCKLIILPYDTITDDSYWIRIHTRK